MAASMAAEVLAAAVSVVEVALLMVAGSAAAASATVADMPKVHTEAVSLKVPMEARTLKVRTGVRLPKARVDTEPLKVPREVWLPGLPVELMRKGRMVAVIITETPKLETPTLT